MTDGGGLTWAARLLHSDRRSAAAALGAALLLAALPARAQDVEKVLKATIEIDGLSSSRKELTLDLNSPGGKLTGFSIPPGGIVQIQLVVVAKGFGVVGAMLMDEDIHETLRGWDDELCHPINFHPFHAGDTSTVHIFFSCDPDADDVHALEDSGEQSAEIYVQAGDVRVPKGTVGAGADPPGSYWKIDCDKDMHQVMSIFTDTLSAFWGDTLVVPGGALAGSVDVKMSNMAPLLDTEARPSSYDHISEALLLEPVATTLATPATLIFKYSPGEVGDLADEHTLACFRYDSAAHVWSLVPGSVVHPENHTLRVPISQFGVYGFAPLHPVLSPTSVQAVATQFGDNSLGIPGPANGSELDQMSVVGRAGWLYVYLGGDLATDFSKLELFFDTVPGGQHRLRGNNPSIDFNGLNRMGDDGSGNGLTFDDGFDADYWMGLTMGDAGGGEYRVYANYATLPTLGGGTGQFLGSTPAGSAGILLDGTNPLHIGARVNNSNVLGVSAGCESASPGAVKTGMELAIPWQALGDPTGCIRVCAFVNGIQHDFVSNQVLGPLPPGTCNLGEPRVVNFSAIPGNQYALTCSLSTVSVPPARHGSTRPQLTVWPNPARGRVTIQLGNAPPAGWIVEVFDLAGRRVRRFQPAEFAFGRTVWRGETDAGAQAPAGLYLVRWRGSSGLQTARFLLVR